MFIAIFSFFLVLVTAYYILCIKLNSDECKKLEQSINQNDDSEHTIKELKTMLRKKRMGFFIYIIKMIIGAAINIIIIAGLSGYFDKPKAKNNDWKKNANEANYYEKDGKWYYQGDSPNNDDYYNTHPYDADKAEERKNK